MAHPWNKLTYGSLASKLLWKILMRIGKCGWANFKAGGREWARKGSSKQRDGESCVWAQVVPTAMGVLVSQKGAGLES